MDRGSTLLWAPHRLMFLAGTVQALAAMALWTWDIGARLGGLWAAPSWPWPPAWIHGLLMIYGVLPFFMFGFAMTAGPRWQGAEELSAAAFVPPGMLLCAGWGTVYAGFAGFPVVLEAGLGLVLVGWILALRSLVRVARHPADERDHILIVVVGFLAGALGLGAFLVFAAGGPAWLARVGIGLGVWGFLLPVFLAVAHRMVPFFSSSAIRGYVVYRPRWALWLLVGAAAVHAVLAALGMQQGYWLADLPAALVAVHLSWRWGLGRSLNIPLIAVLHLGFAWVGVAFALSAAQSALLALGTPVLGLAPLHALTIGGFASILLGMASRVTLGHSGQLVRADRSMWWGFWTLQAATALRVASDLLVVSGPLNPAFVAALLWLAAWGNWAWRYAPNYWRPRSDGKPG